MAGETIVSVSALEKRSENWPLLNPPCRCRVIETRCFISANRGKKFSMPCAGGGWSLSELLFTPAVDAAAGCVLYDGAASDQTQQRSIEGALHPIPSSVR